MATGLQRRGDGAFLDLRVLKEDLHDFLRWWGGQPAHGAHQGPSRWGNVNADSMRLKAMVTIQRTGAGGSMATSRERIPRLNVTLRAILRPCSPPMFLPKYRMY